MQQDKAVGQGSNKEIIWSKGRTYTYRKFLREQEQVTLYKDEWLYNGNKVYTDSGC